MKKQIQIETQNRYNGTLTEQLMQNKSASNRQLLQKKNDNILDKAGQYSTKSLSTLQK